MAQKPVRDIQQLRQHSRPSVYVEYRELITNLSYVNSHGIVWSATCLGQAAGAQEALA
jgi:hypothetical protein